MNTYNYAVELAKEIIKTKETRFINYFEFRSKDNEFVQYVDKYVDIKAAKNTNALYVEIFKPLTVTNSNPIIYVDDEGECFRNHGERSGFCLYAELLLKKTRTIYFNEWSRTHEKQIESLFE